MPARLTVYPSNQPVQQFALDPERGHLIGRGPDCDLRIDDSRLSRRHARLAVAAGRWQFDDLGSKNGTALAGRALDETALKDGDWISFGGLLGQFADLSVERLAAEEQRAHTRWEDTIDRSRLLDPEADVEALLQRMLQTFLELAGAERAFVMLAEADSRLHIRARAGATDKAPGSQNFPGSRSAVARALETRAPVVVCDTSADILLGARPSVVIGQIRALVCLPLEVGEQLTGLVYLDSAVPGKVFTRLDLEICEAFASHAALVIGAATVRDDLSGIAALLPREMSRTRTRAPERLRRRLQAALPFVRTLALPDGELL